MPPQMSNLLRHPLVILVLSYCVMALSAQLGLFFRRKQQQLEDTDYHDRGVVLGATLTLLGLLIGFIFPWPSAGTANERTAKNRKPTPLARNICAPICSLSRTLRVCA
jgi:hypothetical protein